MTLQDLLNTLIQRGLHPFGRKYNSETGGDHNTISFNYYDNIDEERGLSNFSIRELVSKESGLWQFVCENKLYKDYVEDRGTYWDSMTKCCNYRDYEYRLIESALKDESELESFILDNIKIEGK